MAHHRNVCFPLVFLSAIAALAACNNGPAARGTFDRNYDVTAPIRLELTNASGDVDIAGSADGKVHVRGEVRASGFGSNSSQKRLDETLANPPIEQKGGTIRIGKEMPRMHNISIAYTIQVPRDTEVITSLASGAQTIRGLRGPVKAQAASGSIRVEKIERDVQISNVSGSVSATDIGNDVRVSSTSGSVTVSTTRGDVRANAVSGDIRVSNPGGRIEADSRSGGVQIQGAASDVKAHSTSGRVSVQGNPGADTFWELKTASGAVQLAVPASANLHLSAEAVSGEIRTDIPIVVEEQGKHSLRAHMGNGGGRVDVHTVSGEIRVSGTN
jgi:putative adhesin